MLYHHNSSSEDTREWYYRFYGFLLPFFVVLTEKIGHISFKKAFFCHFGALKRQISAIKGWWPTKNLFQAENTSVWPNLSSNLAINDISCNVRGAKWSNFGQKWVKLALNLDKSPKMLQLTGQRPLISYIRVT